MPEKDKNQDNDQDEDEDCLLVKCKGCGSIEWCGVVEKGQDFWCNNCLKNDPGL